MPTVSACVFRRNRRIPASEGRCGRPYCGHCRENEGMENEIIRGQDLSSPSAQGDRQGVLLARFKSGGKAYSVGSSPPLGIVPGNLPNEQEAFRRGQLDGG